MDKSISILSKVNNGINSNSVRDCLRLGRYHKDQNRPCPLLLKLYRAVDVISVLSNPGANQDKSISIKPDMTPDEKQKEALLLKKRGHYCCLVLTKQMSRSGEVLFNTLWVIKKHGYVSNSVFHSVNASPPTMSVDGDSTNNSN